MHTITQDLKCVCLKAFEEEEAEKEEEVEEKEGALTGGGSQAVGGCKDGEEGRGRDVPQLPY